MEICDVLWDIKVTKVLENWREKENYHIPVVRHWSDADVPDIYNNIDIGKKVLSLNLHTKGHRLH